ncbi:MAG: FAD-dependent oxidoreductase [Paracoccus sp. (in: a-proteobacteria)]|uniref:NAD(P)/FAD-dependent oxidoreductase n=1 Tax=Paracoccus sp. TaxID=267 RepID=UPI0026DFA07D|nr:FAD-dependent oxidoreductase [Paracoccus sp. (in: a-proteobacteria)]MDO5611761.1 FAD-dependent oxidoreductase [Paracoccus sp. (in: a-proteobacteria)]
MRIVIAGAGQAAASLAAKLRALGHEGPLTVIGDEAVPPYQRPPLSKAYLLGQMGIDRLTLRAPEWWEENGIELRTGTRATAIDTAARRVETDAGPVPYDALALCLGARPRRLPDAIGGHLPGVHTIRDLSDVDQLRPDLTPGARLVVIGGGYIGLEAAAVARKLGLEVTLIESAPRILGRVAAAETADLIRNLHSRHGTQIREGEAITRITGPDRATGVELASGEQIPADVIVTGIGVTPVTDLAETAGLATENGIATDSFGRSSDSAIWAAGDCASMLTDIGWMRLESVGNAIDMAETVAANIMGADKPYIPKPWFWSDQYDAKLQIAGLGTGADRIVTRAGDQPGNGSVWYFRGPQLIAVDALNDARAYMIGKRLIDAGRTADPDAIATTPDLKALL